MNNISNGKIEKNIHRSNFQRLLHTLCLLIPIASAFLGFYCSEPLWQIIKKTEPPELFKFILSLVFFAIPSILIFILTRKSNSIIKIKISN